MVAGQREAAVETEVRALGEDLLSRLSKNAAWVPGPEAGGTAGGAPDPILMVELARHFIAGRDATDALPTLRRLWSEHAGFTLAFLGEAAASEESAQAYLARYMEALDALAAEAAGWRSDPVLDAAPWGRPPRADISLKVTSIQPQMDPADPVAMSALLADRLRPLFRSARTLGVGVMLDMEQYRYREITFAAFSTLLSDPEFADYPHLGIVVQALVRDSPDQIRALLELSRFRGTPFNVRLVRGAYLVQETTLANQEHWPVPVFCRKADTDANFERLTGTLIENAALLRPVIATHNVRSMAYAVVAARRAGLPDTTTEFQLIHGVADSLKGALADIGLRVRVYVPAGDPSVGKAYLSRRVQEFSDRDSHLRRLFVDREDARQLLSPPRPTPDLLAVPPQRTDVYPTDPAHPARFRNEPRADFSRPAERADMLAALGAVRSSAGAHHPLMIAGREVDTKKRIESVNPAHPGEVLGTVASAGAEEAAAAVTAGLRAFPQWRDTRPEERAALIFRAAEIMRRRRHALTALEVLEAGKPWREADGDVTEAIDFLEYYGRDMLRLAAPRPLQDIPGETDVYFYEPRGLTVVIPPWNFPLAIPTGMVCAALVAGNPVILKPASPTPLVAYELVRILREAGLPEGTIAYLPGPGPVVGPALSAAPGVDVVAFTGSRDVGLSLLRETAVVRPGQRNVKKVVVEMGGKNAIIVDADADLAAAVEGVLASAFGYSGQKCSACSRAIVLDSVHDAFMHRLLQVLPLLPVGDPAEAATKVGPVITKQAQDKILGYIAAGSKEATLAAALPTPGCEGWYVAPHIFDDVPPEATIAQEEIFGPVLSVLRATNLDEAFAIALATPYGLTGGIYSNDPDHIERAYREFRVGNLYVNRGITGAMVGRQPFGGSRMSGVGSKTGGPDYLLQFLEPRVVTENILRTGYIAPRFLQR